MVTWLQCCLQRSQLNYLFILVYNNTIHLSFAGILVYFSLNIDQPIVIITDEIVCIFAGYTRSVATANYLHLQLT